MPAKLKELRRARSLRYGHRELKMLRPICGTCQEGDNVAPDWWKTCPHEPYVGTRTETTTVRKYEDAKGADGKPTGERIVVGTEETTVERPFPNFVSVSLSDRIDSGRGEEKGRRKGFIRPEELRCAAFPTGIAPCCEFRECYAQEGLKTYNTGTYCREAEAAAIYEDNRGRPIEINNMEIRQEQIDTALSKVR